MVSAIAAVSVTLVMPVRAVEQRTTAVFSGRVLDPDGVPVADSVVFMTHVDSGAQLELITGNDGRFEFSGLAPGAYRITSMTSGFGRVEITLDAGDVVRRDFTLQFGPFQESWLIAPSNGGDRARAGRGNGGEWTCASRGLPFCGPPSLVAEFDRDERERLGEPVLQPRPVHMIPMEYPAQLRAAKLEGRIVVEGRLGTDGVLSAMVVRSSDRPELDQPTLNALAQVRWEPARLRGKPIAVPLTVAIRYVLTPATPPPGR